MSDEQIKQTIKKILGILHDPETGWNAARYAMHKKYKDNKSYNHAKFEYVRNIVRKYGITDRTTLTEMWFMMSGKDVVENHLQETCGQAAKAFCYVNSTLPKSEQLDLKIMMSTDMEHLMDASIGHTLPCVKMSDGKYHAFDPQICLTDKQPDVQIIESEIKKGNVIYHLLEGITGRPYKIMAVMSWPEYEKKISDFGNFLVVSVDRSSKAKMITGAITNVLKTMNFTNSIRQDIYTFCREIQNTNLPIQVASYSMGNGKNQYSFVLTVKLDGVLYYFIPYHTYLYMHKLEDLGNNKFLDLDGNREYNMISGYTPAEYIKWFETNVMAKTHEHVGGITD